MVSNLLPTPFQALSKRARNVLIALGGEWTIDRMLSWRDDEAEKLSDVDASIKSELRVFKEYLVQVSHLTLSEECKAMRSSLSHRAQFLLELMFGDCTPVQLLSVSRQDILAQRNAGKRTADEILRFRTAVLDSIPKSLRFNPQTDALPGFPSDSCDTHYDSEIPSLIWSGLSKKAQTVLSKLKIPHTPRGLFSIKEPDILGLRGVGERTLREIFALRDRCREADLWNEENCSSPSSFKSLVEFVETPAMDLFGSAKNYNVIMRDYMGILGGGPTQTLEEVGSSLGVTRERVRQIAAKIQRKLFLQQKDGYFASFLSTISNLFRQNGWIVQKGVFEAEVDKMFGWTGTKAENICQVLFWLGEKGIIVGDSMCILGFDVHLKDRYASFLHCVNHHKGPLSGLDYEPIKERLSLLSPALSPSEFEVFVRKGIEIHVHKKGKSKLVRTTDINSLLIRRYYDQYLNGTNDSDLFGSTTILKSLVHQVLQDAGVDGLTAEDIHAQCSRVRPDLKWTVHQIQAIVAYNRPLDTRGTQVIGYERGNNVGAKTRYSLTSFFEHPSTKALLNAAGAEVRHYMETTGLGVVSVWKIWNKFRPRMPIAMPKLGFYMMMRHCRAGGLTYPDYPKICYPSVKFPKKAYAWELYEYFTYCGRKRASLGELLSFFIDAIGMQPNLAFPCAFPTLGLNRADESRQYELRKPDETQEPPLLLLPPIKNFRDFSLVKPEHMRKASLSKLYFDADGRPITHRTYAKAFFRSLEESHFTFSSSDLSELLDPGWCKVHLKIPKALLLNSKTVPRLPPFGYWRERFAFGDEQYYISSSWDVRNKRRFDIWAKRIAAQANIEFEPFDIPEFVDGCQE